MSDLQSFNGEEHYHVLYDIERDLRKSAECRALRAEAELRSIKDALEQIEEVLCSETPEYEKIRAIFKTVK